MRRTLVACSVALLLAGAGAAQTQVGVSVVRLENGVLTADVSQSVVQLTTETRTIQVNGQQKQVTVTVPTTVTQTVQMKFKFADVSFHDLDGLKIDSDKVGELLKTPRAVVVAPGGKLDAARREAFKDGTLVMSLPQPKSPALPIRGAPRPPVVKP